MYNILVKMAEKGKTMYLKDNELDVKTYLELRTAVSWRSLTKEQAAAAIKGSLLTVVAYDGDKPIGMGRIVGDGAVICYIQKKGVGRMIIDRLVKFAKDIKFQDTEIMLDLMCAVGRENFYKKFGFIARPTDKLGPGMIKYIDKQ